VLLTHLVNLLVHSAAIAPTRISWNWGGVAFAVFVFAATELALWWSGEMTGRWTKNVLIGLGAVVVSWIGLFVVSIVLTVFDDHQNLAGAAARIKKDGAFRRDGLISQLNSTRDGLGGQIANLKTSCAVKEGINQTLQAQNRTQQSTINGCLNQAMKLLTPEAQKITALVLHSEEEPQNMVEFIVIINKTVEHPRVTVQCNKVVTGAQINIVGTLTSSNGGMIRDSDNAWEVEILSPAWSQTSPLYARLIYQGSKGIGCSFILH